MHQVRYENLPYAFPRKDIAVRSQGNLEERASSALNIEVLTVAI